jgi:beta-N-acetylhexosaminidase
MGLQMRLDSSMRFPRQMTLGAMPDAQLIYKMGAEVARQFKLLGIHVNFAPDIDINNNAQNPVINTRSFGQDKYAVAQKGLLYMRGMQQNGLLACGKHFPGHGNTSADSHYELPVITQSMRELDSLELYPFRQLIANGLGSVMVAHLNIPALDSSGIPSTLSTPIVKQLLKNKMGFNGLVFTDALNMKGVAAHYKVGALEVLTLKAGSDVLLCPENVPVAIDSIINAMQTGYLDSIDVYESVVKVLQLKHWCGVLQNPFVDTTKLYQRLNENISALQLNQQMYGTAITLLRNKDVLPLTSFNNRSLASIVINDSINNLFQEALGRYADVKCFKMEKDVSIERIDALVSSLSKYQTVIVSIHNTNTKAGNNYGITESYNSILNKLATKCNVILVVFGNTYTLSKLKIPDSVSAIIMAYEDTYLPNDFAAQILFGAQQPTGSLPVSADSVFTIGSGLGRIDKSNVLSYGLHQVVDSNMYLLSGIDSIALEAIAKKVMPGCQILVAHKGSVIYQKSFGTKTYSDATAINNNMLYDIASITKISATALAVMHLVDNGQLDITKKVSKYLPEFKKSNKRDITIADVMTHQAGLLPFIPFYKETLEGSNYKPGIYKAVKTGEYNVQVADSMFVTASFSKGLWQRIVQSELRDTGKYVYSDLGPIIMQHIVEAITHLPLDSFVLQIFYQPMGLGRIAFNPKQKFERNDLVPTELDTIFRKQLIHGFVHDQTAALMGGVSGNAGLFANAQNVAVLMSLLLQEGSYGGQRYINAATVKLFTSKYNNTLNRRGLLFDKPDTDTLKSPCAASASQATFGHQGFTGTCAWADPINDLVFVFLSNRVYPNAENNALAKQNIRTRMMQIAYDAIGVKQKIN